MIVTISILTVPVFPLPPPLFLIFLLHSISLWTLILSGEYQTWVLAEALE